MRSAEKISGNAELGQPFSLVFGARSTEKVLVLLEAFLLREASGDTTQIKKQGLKFRNLFVFKDNARADSEMGVSYCCSGLLCKNSVSAEKPRTN